MKFKDTQFRHFKICLQKCELLIALVPINKKKNDFFACIFLAAAVDTSWLYYHSNKKLHKWQVNDISLVICISLETWVYQCSSNCWIEKAILLSRNQRSSCLYRQWNQDGEKKKNEVYCIYWIWYARSLIHYWFFKVFID